MHRLLAPFLAAAVLLVAIPASATAKTRRCETFRIEGRDYAEKPRARNMSCREVRKVTRYLSPFFSDPGGEWSCRSHALNARMQCVGDGRSFSFTYVYVENV